MSDGQSEACRQHDEDQQPLQPRDWVMAIADCPRNSEYAKGNVGQVKNIDEDGDLWVKWMDGPGSQRMDGVWCIGQSDVVRIDPLQQHVENPKRGFPVLDSTTLRRQPNQQNHHAMDLGFPYQSVSNFPPADQPISFGWWSESDWAHAVPITSYEQLKPTKPPETEQAQQPSPELAKYIEQTVLAAIEANLQHIQENAAACGLATGSGHQETESQESQANIRDLTILVGGLIRRLQEHDHVPSNAELKALQYLWQKPACVQILREAGFDLV